MRASASFSSYVFPSNITAEQIKEAAQTLILSASGWRKIFGLNSESMETVPADTDLMLAAFIADTFCSFLDSEPVINGKICLGTDCRPTSPLLAEVFLRILHYRKLPVFFLGQCSAPEIMCFVKQNRAIRAFAYITASHNPAGHNGFKFGLSDGAVLGGNKSASLISLFRKRLEKEINPGRLSEALSSCGASIGFYRNMPRLKKRAFRIYRNFILDIASFPFYKNRKSFLKSAVSDFQKRNIGIIAELNGSARSLGPDAEILKSCGIGIILFNDEPGKIVHRIVPEGSSLDLCCELLEKQHETDKSFILGYVPDNDGDRGNLVYYSEKHGRALPLPAQQVFALAVLAELLFVHDLPYCRRAIVINGPSSNRINAIADILSCTVFRVEVGEANVVMKAAELDENGYFVRIIGEGSNGGNITLPSTVRDPLNTILAVCKLLGLKCRVGNNDNYFSKWCDLSKQKSKYRPDYTLDDILDTLPAYTTTDAFEERAKTTVTISHKELKQNYERIFPSEWRKNLSFLQEKYGIFSYKIINYEGIREFPGPGKRSGNETGGFKIEFFDNSGHSLAYIWMRGSGTEPVFRILADVRGDNPQFESFLLDWHKSMINTANGG